jgi:serine/threonine protein kinase
VRNPGLVTEFAEGGSLWDLMGGDAVDEQRMALDELTVLTIAEEILAGLAVLHDNDIVHRDIKPQNVLRCDDVWKIADSGISKLMNNPVTGYTFQGAHTAPWAPPEQIPRARRRIRPPTSTPGAGWWCFCSLAERPSTPWVRCRRLGRCC